MADHAKLRRIPTRLSVRSAGEGELRKVLPTLTLSLLYLHSGCRRQLGSLTYFSVSFLKCLGLTTATFCRVKVTRQLFPQPLSARCSCSCSCSTQNTNFLKSCLYSASHLHTRRQNRRKRFDKAVHGFWTTCYRCSTIRKLGMNGKMRQGSSPSSKAGTLYSIAVQCPIM